MLIVFACLFFSIPACSFVTALSKITWLLAIVLVALMAVEFIFFYRVKIDIVVISLSLFCISILISSLINGFRNFTPTYILLTLFTVGIYAYCSSNKPIKKLLILALYLGAIAFLFYFIFTYRSALLSFDMSRLGGATISLYFLFFNKNLFVKIFALIFSALFGYCAVTSASKIVIILLFIILTVFIFILNGKKRWWISLVAVGGIIGLGVVLLSLPFASSIRYRFLSMLNVFVATPISGGSNNDLSTVERLVMFLNGMEMFMRKPLFGFGANGFATYGGINNGWSHNHVSEILCNSGIVGTILYHIPFAFSIIHYVKDHRRSKLIYFSIMLFYSIAAISIALPGEKMFAFIIGIVYSELVETRDVFSFSINKVFKKKEIAINENS